MPDSIDFRSQADFSSARSKALWRELLAVLMGRRDRMRLLAYEEVREKLRLGGPIHRGVQTVPVRQIIGSVNRYRDFDRAFLPTQAHTASRWRRVSRAWYEDVSLPPVLLYQVGDAYFVVDGNHRVSVARELGQEYIDAEVREVQARVPVSADLLPEHLEVLGAKVEFLERSRLDQLRPEADVNVTVLGGYERLLEHMAVHRYFMGLDFQRDVSEAEAVEHWYDTVYRPVVDVLQAHGVAQNFPERTEADLYLWVMDHRHYLVAQGKAELVQPGQAAEEFVHEVLDRDDDE